MDHRPLHIRLLDLIFYSNLFIGLGALCFTWQTLYLIKGELLWDPYLGLVLSAAFSVYGAHRLIGFSQGRKHLDTRRSKIITKYKFHLIFYTIVGAIGTIYYSFYLLWKQIVLLIIPGITSLLYITPVFKEQQRLRDLKLVKLFAIAVVWVWVGTAIVIFRHEGKFGMDHLILLAERFFFMIAITLPFDIRDAKIDALEDILTLPVIFGKKNAVRISAASGMVSAVFVLLNLFSGFYSFLVATTLLMSLLFLLLILPLSLKITHDYFYIGLLDGMLILQFLLVIAV